MTRDTCGQLGSNSYDFADLLSSTENRSRVQKSSEGYTIRMRTCKVCGSEKSCDEFRTFSARRKFRSTCKDCQNEQERKRRLKTPTRTADQRKDWRKKNRGSALVASARVRARERSLPFDLNAEMIQRRIDFGRCEMTGIPFDLDGDWNAPSLDRKEPEKGYVMDNIRVVITALNIMMNRWGPETVLTVADALKQKQIVRDASDRLTNSLKASLEKVAAQRGSTLYRLTWKERVTPSGRSIPALRATAPRTSGKGSDSPPTIYDLPQVGWNICRATDGSKGGPNQANGALSADAALSGWSTAKATDEQMARRSSEAADRFLQRPQKSSELGIECHLAGWTTTTRDWKDSGADIAPRSDTGKDRFDQLPRQANLAGWSTTTVVESRTSVNALSPMTKNGQASSSGLTLSQQAELAAGIVPREVITAGVESRIGILSGWNTAAAAAAAADGNGGKRPHPDTTMTGKHPNGNKINMGLSSQAHLAFINTEPARLTASGAMLTGSSAGMESGGQLSPSMSRWLMALPASWDEAAPLLKTKRASKHVCQHCSTPLVRKQFPSGPEAIGNFEKRKFCDRTCMANWMEGRMKVEAIKNSRRQSAKTVGLECEICSRSDTRLSVHHRDENPMNNDPSNLQTLCGSCHSRCHSPNYAADGVTRINCAFCNEPSVKRGVCHTHLGRWKRHGHPLAKKRKIGSDWVLMLEHGGEWFPFRLLGESNLDEVADIPSLKASRAKGCSKATATRSTPKLRLISSKPAWSTDPLILWALAA
jgi:hypothetical protein